MAKRNAVVIVLVFLQVGILLGIVTSIGGFESGENRHLAMGAISAEAQETVEQTLHTGSSPRLVINNPVGSVVIKAWDKPVIGVEAVKKAYADTEENAQSALREIEVNLSSEEDLVKVDTILPHPPVGAYSFPSRRFVVEYFITAPAQTEIVGLQVARGTANVSGITGPVRQVIAAGTVRITDSQSDVIAQSTRGGIYVAGAEGHLFLRANGEVQVRDAKGVTLDGTSSKGPLSFSGRLIKGAENRIQSHGAVLLLLPSDSELALDLETHKGDIKIDFPLTNSERKSEGNILEKQKVIGVVKKPSTFLEVRSNTGGIVVQEQK